MIEQRENQRHASEASLLSSAINAAFSKDAAKQHNKTVKSLSKPVLARTMKEDLDYGEPTDFSHVDVDSEYGGGSKPVDSQT